MYEQIKAEIERRMFDDYNGPDSEQNATAQGVCAGILAFINSLPEEKPSKNIGQSGIQPKSVELESEELEKAAKIHIRKVITAIAHPGWNWETWDVVFAFKAGAEWQKEQMIPVTALVNESKDFLSLSLSTEEYAKIGRRFKGGDDIEIYIKQDKK